MKNKIISILFLGAGLFLSGCSTPDIQVLSSDEMVELGECHEPVFTTIDGYNVLICLKKYCPNGYDIVSSPMHKEIVKCKP